jgi:hypothetical protein
VVRTTNKLSPTTSLSGVYAEMTWAIGQTGTDACNSATDYPAGVNDNDGLGLWAIPSMLTSGLNYSDSVWSFKYNTGSYFRFGGVVKAAKLTEMEGSVGNGPIKQEQVDNLVYAATGGRLQRMVISTEVTGGTTRPIAGDGSQAVLSLSVDAARNRIWFGSGRSGGASYVGYVPTGFTGDGTETGPVPTITASLGVDQVCASVFYEPTNTSAWVSCRTSRNVFTVSEEDPPVARTAFTLNTGGFSGEALPEQMVADTGNLYFTFKAANRVGKWAKARTESAIAPLWDVAATGNCANPSNIILSPDGALLYFLGTAASDGNTTAGICSVSIGGGTVTEVTTYPIVDATNPHNLCFNESNDLVFTAGGQAQLVRVKAAGTSTSKNWVIDTPFAAGPCGSASDGTTTSLFYSGSGQVTKVNF